MPKSHGQVSRYKSKERVLVGWLLDTAEKKYDPNGNLRGQNSLQLLEGFLKVARYQPELVHGIVVPPEILHAALVTQDARQEHDMKMRNRARIRSLQGAQDDEVTKALETTKMHMYYTKRLKLVVAVLSQMASAPTTAVTKYLPRYLPR